MPLNAAEMSVEEQVRERVRTGKPVPLVNMRIIDSKGRFLPHNGEDMGEVVVRTPWLTQGYLNEPDKSDELWANGWMHTGDVGSIDAGYTLQIRDRINPVIELAAVVGLPDAEWGERPHAVVTVRSGASVSYEDLVAHMTPLVEEGHIEKWAIPDSLKVVAEIPRTSVGKIDKKLIRSQLAD